LQTEKKKSISPCVFATGPVHDAVQQTHAHPGRVHSCGTQRSGPVCLCCHRLWYEMISEFEYRNQEYLASIWAHSLWHLYSEFLCLRPYSYFYLFLFFLRQDGSVYAAHIGAPDVRDVQRPH
jgi:hypothetical protein